MRSFHDAVILGITKRNGNLEIEIEDVEVANEAHGHCHESGKLVIEGLLSLTEDDKEVDLPTSAFDDGQILELKMGEQSVNILVEWTKYAPRKTDVREYGISGAAVRWIPKAGAA